MMTRPALRRLLAVRDHASVLDRAWLGRGGAGGAGWEALRQRIAALERPVFPLQGRDALAIGLAPGPSRVGGCWRRARPGGWTGADRRPRGLPRRLRELAAEAPRG
jgi:hypothetical protein